MKITIIHKPGCALCDAAVREFSGDGHEVEPLRDLSEVENPERRRDMMADMLSAGGDKDAFPLVFVYDRFIPWRAKAER